MQIVISSEAQQHLLYWKKTGNKAILTKISKLTDSILITPYSGIGKPEALKYELSNKWSRRINKEHRYIYLVEDDSLFIFSLMGHY